MDSLDKMMKGPDNSALRFFYTTEKNNADSERLGRPAYDKLLCVEIFTPGSRDSSPVIELEREFDKDSDREPRRRENHIARFAEQYKAFKAGNDDPNLVGTPIEQWPGIDVQMAATCREMKIFTVQALGDLSDDKLRVLGMGGRVLREQAKAWLEAAANNAPVAALAKENADLKEMVDSLREQVSALDARLTAANAEAAKPAKPTKVV